MMTMHGGRSRCAWYPARNSNPLIDESAKQKMQAGENALRVRAGRRDATIHHARALALSNDWTCEAGRGSARDAGLEPWTWRPQGVNALECRK